MSSITLATNSGLRHIADASAGGFLVNITDFKLTEETNFAPNVADTALVGSVAYKGKIIVIEALNGGLVKFVCEIPLGIPSIGILKFGEIGLYLSTGELFAHGKLDPVYPKSADLGLRINVIVGAINLGAVTNVTIADAQSIPSYPAVNILPDPLNLGENAISVLDGFVNSDNSNSPLVAAKYGPGGSLWGYSGMDRVFYGNPSAITLSTLQLPNNDTTDFNQAEKVIIHITSGKSSGQSRRFYYDIPSKTFTESENKPFLSVDDTSRIAIWRTPQAEIESLRRRLELLVSNLRWADTYEYNQLADRVNRIVGPPTGTRWPDTFGYGQDLLHILVRGDHPSRDNWLKLYFYLKIYRTHQTGVEPVLYPQDFRLSDGYHGTEYVKEQYKTLLLEMQPLENNHANTVPSRLVTITPPGGTSVKTGTWTELRTHEVHYKFEDIAALKAYFNSGGNVSVTADLANPVGADSVDWAIMLTSIANQGGIVLSGGSVTPSQAPPVAGVYEILSKAAFNGGPGWVRIFTNHIIGPISTRALEYWCSVYIGPDGELILIVGFEDFTQYQLYALQGTLTSTGHATKAADASIAYPPIKFPVVTSGGTLTLPDPFIPAGALLAQNCVGFDLVATYANGSGGTYTQVVQANSGACGYVNPITNPPAGTLLSQVCSGTTLVGNYANGTGGSYTQTIQANSTSCGYVIPTVFPQRGTMISQSCVGVNLVGTYNDGTGGSYTQTIQANSTSCGYVAPANNPAAGTLLRTYCDVYTLMGAYANGSGGEYTAIIQGNSSSCGYVTPPNYLTRGTYLRSYCDGFNLRGVYADGNGGEYNQILEFNSSSCGYAAYPASGTLISTFCDSINLTGTYANGSGGTYNQVIEYNSASCNGSNPGGAAGA